MRTFRALLAILCIFSEQAFAQRGRDFSQPAESPLATPMSGIPNMFDTNVLPPGKFYAEVPAFSFDYGLTEKATIGTNMITSLFLAAGAPVVMLKGRYRYHASSRYSNAFTLYQTYANTKPVSSKDPLELSLSLATHNTTYFFDEYRWFTFTLMGLHGYLEAYKPESIKYQKVDASALILSANYQHFFDRQWGVQALLLYPALVRFAVDTAAVNANASQGADLKSLPLMRVLFDYLPDDRWTVAGGGFVAVTSAGTAVLPYASVGIRW